MCVIGAHHLPLQLLYLLFGHLELFNEVGVWLTSLPNALLRTAKLFTQTFRLRGAVRQSVAQLFSLALRREQLPRE